MASLPSGITELQEGTLACSSANPDFRQNFNWTFAALYNMLTDTDVKTGKKGLKVNLTIPDHPKLEVVYV